jgi:hypothetical protein
MKSGAYLGAGDRSPRRVGDAALDRPDKTMTDGYGPLLKEIVKFFQTGSPPVSPPLKFSAQTPAYRARVEFPFGTQLSLPKTV